ncbi:putative phosphatase YfbT [Vibrio variabilis]|uniref:Phosphatase YfbT n=1 Tax=Vibrio variabilis TaxID=990271 RepID=A0ABQ0JKW7_9VIBR|nr:putative phosphatase YfbT [Vibrio variabilis]
MTTLSFKGLLFDLDGTLVDSIPCVTRAWSKWAESKGLDPDYVMSRIHGRPAIDSIAELMNAPITSDVVKAEFDYLEHYEATNTEALSRLQALSSFSMDWMS